MTLAISAWLPIRQDRATARAWLSVGWWALVLLCVTSAAIGRLVYLVKTFDADGAMFVYMGKLTSEGGRLCHDLVDNKFPTVGLMTSAAWRAFGANWSGYVLLGAALSFATALLLTRIARRHVGAGAVLPVALFALVYLNFNPAVFGGFQLETMQVFFAVLAAGAAIESLSRHGDVRDAFVVGLACGCAAMLKPTGLAVGAAFVVALVHAQHRELKRMLARLATMSLGLAVPALVTLAYLIAADLLRDMPALTRQISTYARESAWSWFDLFKPPTVAVILGLPFVVRGWVCRRERESVGVPHVARDIVWFVAAWFVFELAGVVSQRRMYAYHFLVIVPPAALLFGMIPRRERLWPLAGALVPVILLSLHSAGNVLQSCYRARATLPASDYLLAHAQPGDAVWRDECMRLLIETNLRPGSRLPMTFLFANHDDAPTEYAAMMLADFERTRPKYIVLRTDFDGWVRHQADSITELEGESPRRANYFRACEQIRAYVEANYVAETRIERETVWRRRDSTWHGRPAHAQSR